MTFNRKQILNSTLSKAVSILLCAFFLLASPAYSDSPKGNSSNDKQISQTNPTNALREAVNGDNQTGINKTKTPEKVQNTSLFSCLWNPIANFCICIWHCITWCWSWIVCIVVGTWHFLLGHWDGLVDLVMGLWNVICHPILTVKALYNSIMHPIVTFYFCWDALCELGSSARGWGEIFFNIELIVIPGLFTAGAGSVVFGGVFVTSRVGLMTIQASQVMQTTNLLRAAMVSSSVATGVIATESTSTTATIMTYAVAGAAKSEPVAGQAVVAAETVTKTINTTAKSNKAGDVIGKTANDSVKATSEQTSKGATQEGTSTASKGKKDVAVTNEQTGKGATQEGTSTESKGNKDAEKSGKEEVDNAKKTYSESRPPYGQGQVDEVWEKAKGPDGKVRDPNTGEVLEWDKSKPRDGQWDMGHKPGKEYQKLYKDYMDGKITKEEFLKEYQNPENYRPESPSANRSRKYEEKQTPE